MGPYNLYVGCISSSIVFTDNANFNTSVAIPVNGNTTQVYTFIPPALSLSYCVIAKNEIVDIDGENWNGPAKLVNTTNCMTDPCYIFDLVSSAMPEYIQFRVKTTTTGGVTHLSPTATISIATIFTYTAKDPTADEVAAQEAVIQAAYFPEENVMNLLSEGI